MVKPSRFVQLRQRVDTGENIPAAAADGMRRGRGRFEPPPPPANPSQAPVSAPIAAAARSRTGNRDSTACDTDRP